MIRPPDQSVIVQMQEEENRLHAANQRLREENESLRRAYVRPGDLREQISTLHAVCRENIISARIIASENKQGEQRSAIARDCHFIIMRTEAVLPPR